MSTPSGPSDPSPSLAASLRSSWHGFLGTYEPLRSDLYRYCRHLTRSPWDAEDLAQDTLARAFVTLGQIGEPPPNPRAWLFRVASNLWLDRVRKLRREEPLGDEPADAATSAIRVASAAREAAGTLIAQLSPQERAAVVLKDVFDLSLDEIAEALSTTTGAIKAALHRGRDKLVEPSPGEARVPRPRRARRLLQKRLQCGGASIVSPRSCSTTLPPAWWARRPSTAPRRRGGRSCTGCSSGAASWRRRTRVGGIEPRFMQGVLPSAPRVELVAHRGEWLLLHWYGSTRTQHEAVRAVTRLTLAGDSCGAAAELLLQPGLRLRGLRRPGRPVALQRLQVVLAVRLIAAARGAMISLVVSTCGRVASRLPRSSSRRDPRGPSRSTWSCRPTS